MKNKIFATLIFLMLSSSGTFALSLKDVSAPAPASNRVGLKNEPESPYVEVKKNTKAQSKKNIGSESQYNTSYADMSLKRLAQDISHDLNLESTDLLSDLQILWGAAATRSETIKYTIYKLSNPDEEKPSEGVLKKIIKPLASFSTIAGTAISSNPYTAAGALVGGGLLNALVKDDREINYKFSKVNDADMVLLVRKIDDLQKRLLGLYIDYITKKQVLAMTQENLLKREDIYKKSSKAKKEHYLIADMYYRNAQNSHKKAQSDFYSARAILENLVGIEAIEEIEK